MSGAQVLFRIQKESNCLAEREGARKEGALPHHLLERARKVEKGKGKDKAQGRVTSTAAGQGRK